MLSHEFVHIVHLDKASGPALTPRKVLGRLMPFFPNVPAPFGIVEGLAINNAADADRAYGRLGTLRSKE